jgi:protein SCO1/2
MLIMFGYTYCPDICPGELQVITNALEELGAGADAIVPVFVTVDPQRDSVAKVAEYIANFSPRIVGLTGTEEEIKAVAKAYSVYFAKEASPAPTPGNEYLISHSTFIFLMSPEGKYVTHFVYGVTAEDMAAKIRKYIGG